MLRRVAAGETFVITNDGRAVGTLSSSQADGWLLMDRPATDRFVTTETVAALPLDNLYDGGSASTVLKQLRDRDRLR